MKTKRKAKIEFKKTKAGAQKGAWRYTVKGSNGEILVTSEGYTSKADAKNGINTLISALLGYAWDNYLQIWKLQGAVMKIIAVTWLLAFSALAADVTATWDANTETNITGYKLYWRTGESYSNFISTTTTTLIATTLTISNVRTGVIFLVATAINTEGSESDYSNEVSFTNSTASKFMVLLGNRTLAQAQAITDIFNAKGWNMCSKIEGVWLISGVSGEITSRTIAEEITSNPLIGAKIKLVLKLPDETPITYWGNATRDVWDWTAKYWGKAK